MLRRVAAGKRTSGRCSAQIAKDRIDSRMRKNLIKLILIDKIFLALMEDLMRNREYYCLNIDFDQEHNSLWHTLSANFNGY